MFQTTTLRLRCQAKASFSNIADLTFEVFGTIGVSVGSGDEESLIGWKGESFRPGDVFGQKVGFIILSLMLVNMSHPLPQHAHTMLPFQSSNCMCALFGALGREFALYTIYYSWVFCREWRSCLLTLCKVILKHLCVFKGCFKGLIQFTLGNRV